MISIRYAMFSDIYDTIKLTQKSRGFNPSNFGLVLMDITGVF